MDTNEGGVSAIIAAARAGQALQVFDTDDGKQVALVPDGFSVKTLSEPVNADLPTRMKARRTFHEGESFGLYVKQYRTAGSQLIANVEGNSLTALIDYPDPSEAVNPDAGIPNREHVAVWPVPLSEEFKVWSAFQGKLHPQALFLEFLEENVSEIYNPDPAAILELVKDFDAIQTVKFASKKRLENGDFNLQYSSETQVKGGVSIPKKVTLEMPIYLGEERVRFDAWFRTRIEEGTLHLGLAFHRIVPVKIAAFRAAVTRVAEIAGLDPQYGSV